MRQRTVSQSVTIEGSGLHTGGKVALRLKGAPPGNGIHFVRTDLADKPVLNLRSLSADAFCFKERRTSLRAGPVEVQTTEHLLGALAGLSIDNIIAELDNAELPGLDGSAKGFVEAIRRAAIVEQAAERKVFEVKTPVWCEEKGSFLAVFPGESFRVSYTLSYDNAQPGTQFYSVDMREDIFEKEIAPARTFCLEEEAQALLKMGIGKGADYENTLVIGRDGPINNTLRFPNEPVRHKILDLIGDLALLGMPMTGHVIAIKSGHALNRELVRRLKDEISRKIT